MSVETKRVENLPHLLAFIVSTLITAIISGSLGGKITLFLTNKKERQEAQVRFTNRFKSLTSELKVNFRYVGNQENQSII